MEVGLPGRAWVLTVKSSRPRWALAVLVLLAFALGAWRVFDTWHAPASPQGTVAKRDTKQAPPPADTTVALRVTLPPMPPASTEFLVALPNLQTRADAGDRRAACRLGYQLLRCQHARFLNFAEIRGEEGREFEHERSGNLAAANHLAEEKLWHLELERDCRSVPVAIRERGADYLRAAARAGDADAMLLYGQGQHFNPTGRGIAVGPEFALWAQEAPGMMHGALRAGNPTAAFSLHMAYADNFGFPNGLIPDDPYQTAVYYLLSVQLFGMTERRVWMDRLGAEEQQQARAEAKRLHDELFDGKRFDSKRTLVVSPYLRAREGQVEPCGDEG